MPLPLNVHEIQEIPRWQVLWEAVKDCEPEDAVIPTWKLKPVLGINSPTPQYPPMMHPLDKPFWMKRSFVKRKMKKFYNKLEQQRLEEMGQKMRYLPDPSSRLSMAGTQLLRGHGVLKTEADMWKTLRKMSTEDILKAMNDQKAIRLGLAGQDLMINWRTPQQITAEHEIRKQIQRVDVVIEVRDARIPWVTTHPGIPQWVRPKPRVIVLTHADLVPAHCLEETIQYIKSSERDRGVPVVGVDAQRGSDEIEVLREELMKAGAYVNRRRLRKGINPRAIRTMLVGFPNVGKSSLINRLSNRKVAPRTSWAGSTKKLTWHKIGGFRNTEMEFLDCPGTIPSGFKNKYTEEQANLLCMCRVFGDVVIDREKTAYELIFQIGRLAKKYPHMVDKTFWRETKRIYGVDFEKALKLEGPILPNFVPVRNPAPFCGKMLNDFNRGFWGKIQLEPPPQVSETRQDWSYGRDAYANGSDDILEDPVVGALAEVDESNPIRGALGAPADMIQMPPNGTAAREKVEAISARARREAQRKREKEGLFDGW